MTDNNNKTKPTKGREIPTGSEDAPEPSPTPHKENRNTKLVLVLLIAVSLIAVVALVCSLTLPGNDRDTDSAPTGSTTKTSLAAISPNQEATKEDAGSDLTVFSTAAYISDSEFLGNSPIENLFEGNSSLGDLDMDEEGEEAPEAAAAAEEEEGKNSFASPTIGAYFVDNDVASDFFQDYEWIDPVETPGVEEDGSYSFDNETFDFYLNYERPNPFVDP